MKKEKADRCEEGEELGELKLVSLVCALVILIYRYSSPNGGTGDVDTPHSLRRQGRPAPRPKP